MSEASIDKLTLSVSTNAGKAATGVDKLAKSLETLGSKLGGLDTGKMKGLESLKDLGKISVSSSLGTNLDQLANGIRKLSGVNMGQLTRLADGLNALNGVGSLSRAIGKSTTDNLRLVGEAASTLNGKDFTGFARLGSGLRQLGNLPRINLGGVTRNLEQLPGIIGRLTPESITRFNQITSGLRIGMESLAGTGKTNLTSTLNQLQRLPTIFGQLKAMDMGEFTDHIRRLSTALSPLADRMNAIGTAFGRLPSNLRRAMSAADRMTGAAKRQRPEVERLSVAWTNLDIRMRRILTLGRAVMITRMVGLGIGKAFNEANTYIENMNLFSVSMGEFARDAEKFAQAVSGRLGIDPAEWLRAQGVFMTLGTGFGIVGDKAAVMSQQLTQMGYDISSFFNISVKDAMQKLESGFAGELEPLRRLGWDLSQARLQAVALELGIDKAFAKMTQSEKAQLRYHAIMTQVTQVQGDMARTLAQPANQMRIFQAQTIQLVRALGNLFIPILMRIIPWAIAVAQVLRGLIDQIGQFLGFSLPQMEFGFKVPPLAQSGVDDMIDGIGDVDTGIDGVGDASEDATKKAEELRNTLAGFDELNIIGDLPKDDKTKAPKLPGLPDLEDVELGDVGLGGDLGVDPVVYDFLDGLVQDQIKDIRKKLEEMLERIKPYFDDILDVVKAIGLGLLAWKITDAIDDILRFFGKEPLSIKKKVGLVLMVAGFSLAASGMYEIGYGEGDWMSVAKTLIGNALGIAGALLTFGTGPLGWSIGIGLALIVNIAAFKLGYDKRKLDDRKAELFGDLQLSEEEVKKLTKNLYADVFIIPKLEFNRDQRNKVEELRDELDGIVAELQSQSRKLDLGIKVTEEEIKTTIDEFVALGQKNLDENHVLDMSNVEIIWGGTESEIEATRLVDGFHNRMKSEFATLAEDLMKVTSEGFVNGEWIPEKRKLAEKLQGEMSQMLAYYEQLQAGANIRKLIGGMDMEKLSLESFKATQEEAGQIARDLETTFNELELEGYIAIEMAVDEAKSEGQSRKQIEALRKQMEADMKASLTEHKMSIEMVNVDFGTGVIKDKWEESWEKAAPAMGKSAAELLEQGLSTNSFGKVFNTATHQWTFYEEGDIKGVNDLFNKMGYAQAVEGLKDSLRKGIESASNLTTEDKKLMRELWEGLKPSADNLIELARQYEAMGMSVPENIAKGISDYYAVSAMLGEADGLNYLLGQSMTESPAAIEAAIEATKLGKQFPADVADGIRSNTKLVYDESTGMVRLMSDTFGTLFSQKLTPELREALGIMGFNLVEGVGTGAENAIKEVDIPGIVIDNLTGNEPNMEAIGKAWGNALNVGFYNAGLGMVTSWNNLVAAIKRSADTFNVKLTGSGNLNLTYSQAGSPVKPQLYAGGGYPPTGELFIAREAGPELVGSIGNRPAVANNDQIVDSVEAGVFRAVSAANRSGGGTTVVPVYIGDEKIYEAVVQAGKRQAQRQGYTGG